MNLEDLVPPLALCRKIPKGLFAASALVWSYEMAEFKSDAEYVRERDLIDDHKDTACPAPTLAEIIPAIVEAGGFHPEIMYKPDDEGNGNHWEVECFTKEDPDTVEDFTICSPLETDSINPATAARKLWLSLSVEDGK